MAKDDRLDEINLQVLRLLVHIAKYGELLPREQLDQIEARIRVVVDYCETDEDGKSVTGILQ